MTPQEKKQEIEKIEKEMRYLFALPQVNQSIVDRYNWLERKWKELKGIDVEPKLIFKIPRAKDKKHPLKTLPDLDYRSERPREFKAL